MTEMLSSIGHKACYGIALAWAGLIRIRRNYGSRKHMLPNSKMMMGYCSPSHTETASFVLGQGQLLRGSPPLNLLLLLPLQVMYMCLYRKQVQLSCDTQ